MTKPHGHGFENSAGLNHNFGANPVAGQECNHSLHESTPVGNEEMGIEGWQIKL
jgi:hypothetical protein